MLVVLFDQIKILYEDKDILVLNKPAGLVVHGDGRTKEKSLTDWLVQNYQVITNVGENIKLSSGDEIKKSGIVHRLDKETSGAIIVAKNQKTYLFLKNQFQNREVEKTYQAFVWGKVKNDEGTINRPIGRSKKDFRLWSAQRGARGEMREAVTDYNVLKRGKDMSLLEIRPKTGRTHQIRVHMKAINHPVVCDKLYSPKLGTNLGFERLALHAKKIKFKISDNKIVEIEAPFPDDFKEALKIFNK